MAGSGKDPVQLEPLRPKQGVRCQPEGGRAFFAHSKQIWLTVAGWPVSLSGELPCRRPLVPFNPS